MNWVMIVWTIWMTDGIPTVDVKTTETYYRSRYACEQAMFDFSLRYQPYTEKGFGYTLKCMEREQWEKQKEEGHESN